MGEIAPWRRQAIGLSRVGAVKKEGGRDGCEVCGWRGDDVIGCTGCGTGRAETGRGEGASNERGGKTT